MLVVGLTGSIGMGKSFAAGWLRAQGVPVFDADAEVHRLYAAEAAPLIEAAFPGSTRDGAVDRGRLSQALQADTSGFRRLEALIHPLVQAAERRFLHTAAAAGASLAVLEIPLLFEIGADAKMDVTIVVSAPPDIQRTRVLARPDMTVAKLDALLARQVPDATKRARADFVVDTGGSTLATEAALAQILDSLKDRSGQAMRRSWS